MMLYERWYWCSGCGKWHDREKGNGMHHLMMVEQEEPDERNFEGLVGDLCRFRVALSLHRADVERLEREFAERVESFIKGDV